MKLSPATRRDLIDALVAEKIGSAIQVMLLQKLPTQIACVFR
jgi:hypothetical protein